MSNDVKCHRDSQSKEQTVLMMYAIRLNVVAHACSPSTGRERQEGQEFKVHYHARLGYLSVSQGALWVRVRVAGTGWSGFRSQAYVDVGSKLDILYQGF